MIPDDFSEKLSVIIKPNEAKIGGLYLGNEQGARDSQMISKKKITAILTISKEIGTTAFGLRNHVQPEIAPDDKN